MADSFQVVCERCNATLKLKNRDSVGKKVACPKCGHKFVIALDDEDEFDDFESPGNAPAVLGSRSRLAARRPAPAPRKSSRKRTSGAPWLWIVAAGAVVLIAAIVLFVPWGGSGTALLSSSVIDRINPLSETPKSIVSKLNGYLDDAKSVIESVLKGGSSEDAVKKMNAIQTRVEDLYLRAVRITPMSADELKTFLKENPDAIWGVSELRSMSGKSEKKDVFDLGKELFAKKDATGSNYDLAFCVTNLKFVRGDILGVWESLIKPAAPESDVDKIEIAMIELVRQTLYALTRVDSQSEMESQAANLTQQADRLSELKGQLPSDRKKLNTGVDQRTAEYRKIRVETHEEIYNVLQLLTGRYGKNAQLSAAAEKLHASDSLPLDPSDPKAMAAVMEEHNATEVEKLAEKHGKEKLLRITVLGYESGNSSGRILHGMAQIVGKDVEKSLEVESPSGSSFADDSKRILLYVTDMDTNEVAAKIDFAKVLKVDAANREITLKPVAFDTGKMSVPSNPDVIFVYVPSAIGEAERKRILEGFTSILGVPTDRSGGDSKKMDVFKFASKADPKEIESKITFATDLHVSPEHRTIQIASPEQEARIRRRKEDQNDVIHQNIAKHGSDKLIIIGAPKTLDAAGQKKIADGMQAILGVAPQETGLTREVFAFVFLSTADPQATANKITFAKVSKVVADKRAILLEAPAS